MKRVPGRHPESFEAVIDSECRSLVVLSEVHAPGYEATIDERPTDIFEAEVGYMGVIVPPGQHHVRFEYRAWARRGWPLSLGALVLAVVLIFSSAWMSRRRAQPAPRTP